MKIEFTDSKFRAEYGRAPKGRGMWAFAFEGYEIMTPMSMTYSEAKKFCKAEVKRLAPADYIGTVIVTVLT